MDPLRLLTRVYALGFSVASDGGQLRLWGPRGAEGAILRELAENKPAVLEVLETPHGRDYTQAWQSLRAAKEHWRQVNEYLWRQGERRGWPALDLGGGVRVLPGRENWARCLEYPGGPGLGHAEALLRAIGEQMLSR